MGFYYKTFHSPIRYFIQAAISLNFTMLKWSILKIKNLNQPEVSGGGQFEVKLLIDPFANLNQYLVIIYIYIIYFKITKTT